MDRTLERTSDTMYTDKMQESMLRQSLHVRIASDTHKINSFDWSNQRCIYDNTLFPAFYRSKRHFKWSDKWFVNTSMLGLTSSMAGHRGRSTSPCLRGSSRRPSYPGWFGPCPPPPGQAALLTHNMATRTEQALSTGYRTSCESLFIRWTLNFVY